MSGSQLKFCPLCGAPLQIQGSRFCPSCGAGLVSNQINNAQSSILTESKHEAPQDEEQETKLKVYDLGVKLEETTAAILQKMGWSTQLRQRMPTRSGPNAEIDVLVTRGNRRRAVECKNYDTSRAVGIAELRVFKNKLDDIEIASGLFVTSSYFSKDAQDFSESNMLEVWDRDELREKYFLYALGRLVNPSLVKDPVLPVQMSYTQVTTLQLKNPQAVQLQTAKLFYHPYILVKYRLRSERTDPTKKKHVVVDDGTAVVDALDGDVINPGTGILSSIGGLLKNAQERAESKSEKIVYNDLLSLSPEKQTILKTSDYDVSVAEAEVSEESAISLMKDYVVKKNTKTVTYQKGRKEDLDISTMKIVPKKKEIILRGSKLVYVPKWDLQYEAADWSFSRRFVASSGGVVEDPLAKCDKCKLMKKPAEVLCEVCGRPLCEKHSVFEDGRWMCSNHSSAPKKQGILGKIPGFHRT